MDSTNNKLPFLTAKARLKSKYDIDMPLDDFIEKAYYIWRTIGNIAINTKSFDVTVPENHIITLPSDCEFISSVRLTQPLATPGNYSSKGRRIQYRDIPLNYDVINKSSIKMLDQNIEDFSITITYDAIATDQDGLPLLNDPEVNAIAANVALQKLEIDLFRLTPGVDKVIAYVKPEADRLLLAARIPEQISDDAINAVLNLKCSYQFKTFGDNLKFE